MTADFNIRFEQVKQRIAEACQRRSRDPETVKLIAVTKAVPADKIREAIACGMEHFGENYLQEALAKRGGFSSPITWHFIGSIQRRKVKSLVGNFEWIHSVDQLEVAEEINRRAANAGIVQKVLVQVNTSQEKTKSGIAPEEALSFVERLKPFASMEVKGFMTIPTPHENPEGSRPEFRLLAELLKEAHQKASYGKAFTELSMGMSSDFEVAIEEGATMVRIGTALFGPRP